MSIISVIPLNYKLLRSIVRTILIGIFLLVPWVKYNDRPAVLLDISSGRFFFPGFVIWHHEIYYLIFLFLIFLGFLYLFTVTFGRVWCGWGCPQTIYVEVFKDIGKMLFPEDFGKRSQKPWQTMIIHTIWVLLSAFFIFHFIGYFVGARTMIEDFRSMHPVELFNQPWPFFFLGLTALFYSDIGVFREQFCVHMCPYSRFQSFLFDHDSLVIGYDFRRGEPRKRTRMNILPAGPLDMGREEGDCTSCNMCTMICPTGIDIREGLQIACVNCTSCIDACTVEMGRFGKKSLIEYGSIRWFESRKPGSIVRSRTVLLTVALAVASGVFAFLLYSRVPTKISVIRDPESIAHVTESTVENFYVISISNLTESEVIYNLTVRLMEGSDEFQEFGAASGYDSISVGPNKKKQMHVVFKGKPAKEILSTRKEYPVLITLKDFAKPENKKEVISTFLLPGEENE